MPYKTGKLKGELTTPEIRKLIKAHNVLVSIKIPKGATREDIIAIVKKNGYEVNHEKQALVPKVEMQRKKTIGLEKAKEITKPKPLTEEEKKQRQQAKQKKAGEKAFLKAVIPKPPAVSKPSKGVKVGKPPPKPKKEEPKIDKKQIDKLSLEYIKEIKKMSPLKTLAEIQSTFKKFEKKMYDFIGTNVDNYEELREYWDDNWMDKISEAIPDGRKKEAPKKEAPKKEAPKKEAPNKLKSLISKIKKNTSRLYDTNFLKEKNITQWFNEWKRERSALIKELKEYQKNNDLKKEDLKEIEPINIRRSKKYKIREAQIFRGIKEQNE